MSVNLGLRDVDLLSGKLLCPEFQDFIDAIRQRAETVVLLRVSEPDAFGRIKRGRNQEERITLVFPSMTVWKCWIES